MSSSNGSAMDHALTWARSLPAPMSVEEWDQLTAEQKELLQCVRPEAIPVPVWESLRWAATDASHPWGSWSI